MGTRFHLRTSKLKSLVKTDAVVSIFKLHFWTERTHRRGPPLGDDHKRLNITEINSITEAKSTFISVMAQGRRWVILVSITNHYRYYRHRRRAARRIVAKYRNGAENRSARRLGYIRPNHRNAVPRGLGHRPAARAPNADGPAAPASLRIPHRRLRPAS